jgi:hypothetical protein
MVMAGELNDADNSVFRVMALMENQKLFCTRQHSAVNGKARKLLNMHILDLAVKFVFVSSRSLRIPLIMLEMRPPNAREKALIIEY